MINTCKMIQCMQCPGSACLLFQCVCYDLEGPICTPLPNETKGSTEGLFHKGIANEKTVVLVKCSKVICKTEWKH